MKVKLKDVNKRTKKAIKKALKLKSYQQPTNDKISLNKPDSCINNIREIINR